MMEGGNIINKPDVLEVLLWGCLDFMEKKKLKDVWPKREDGTEVPRLSDPYGGTPMDEQILLTMLEAYGIPAVTQYPNDGSFGKVILGVAGGSGRLRSETMLNARAL